MTQEKKVEPKHAAKSDDRSKDQKERRPKDLPSTKVVVRRLPSSLTAEQFLEVISPVPEYNYFNFKSDPTLGPFATSRAYLNFVNHEDIIEFTQTFDGYVFVDNKGGEYAAVVEFSPFQKIPKKKPKKPDSKKGTIEEDNDYNKFLEQLENPETAPAATPESFLEEIEQRERDKDSKGPRQTTPLLDYIKRKKEDKRVAIQKARDERKRREIDRRKQREEERRKRRERERERGREKERDRERDRQDSGDGVPQFKLLKNTERDGEQEGGNKNHSNQMEERSNRPKTWREKEAERKREKERERAKNRDAENKYLDDEERVPSYARKDDDKDNPKKDAGERGSKEKPKNTTRRYESAKQQRDRRDDRDGKKEPELRFSKKAREREKELKKEREKESNNGKGRGYSDRDRNDGESKRSQDRTKDEEDREETAMEKKERIRKERIRNKDRPERAIYVPGAARRAQQQKSASGQRDEPRRADRATREQTTPSPREEATPSPNEENQTPRDACDSDGDAGTNKTKLETSFKQEPENTDDAVLVEQRSPEREQDEAGAAGGAQRDDEPKAPSTDAQVDDS